MFQIFNDLARHIQDKKEQPDKKKEKLTFEEFAELFQQCPIPEVEYTKHFEAFIQTLEVEDEGFKDDLKKCYALCSYRLDKALWAPEPETEAKPEPEAKPEEKPAETKEETSAEVKEESIKQTGGGHIPACLTSIRLKTIASKKRDEVFRQITG
uniref:Uncharacterized protein n=1 Tax=viral metagenome TaxID=1070528 RepID=A0A6C0HPK2_9ZZZZ